MTTPPASTAEPRQVPATVVRRRASRKRGAKRTLSYVTLCVLAALFAVPFFWLLTTSLKSPQQLFRIPLEWIPDPVTWSNYPRALTYILFFLYLKNTVYIALFVAIVISCSLAAYGFARIAWPGRNVVFVILIATLMIPYPVTLIPQFLIFRELGWMGTPAPLTWPAFTGNPFFIFMLRQFYLTIPQDLSAAARIDGLVNYKSICGSFCHSRGQRWLSLRCLPLCKIGMTF